jgi:hypothetical protein
VAQEPEGSSPHSQQPATGPCPEPVESNQHPLFDARNEKVNFINVICSLSPQFQKEI